MGQILFEKLMVSVQWIAIIAVLVSVSFMIGKKLIMPWVVVAGVSIYLLLTIGYVHHLYKAKADWIRVVSQLAVSIIGLLIALVLATILITFSNVSNVLPIP